MFVHVHIVYSQIINVLISIVKFINYINMIDMYMILKMIFSIFFSVQCTIIDLSKSYM